MNIDTVAAGPVSCSDGQGDNVDGTIGVVCFGSPHHNDGGKDYGVIQGTFGIDSWMRAGKTDESGPFEVSGDFGTNPANVGLQGIFWFDSDLFARFDDVMIFFKGGVVGSTAFLLDPAGFSDVTGAATIAGFVGLSCNGNFAGAGLSGPDSNDCVGDWRQPFGDTPPNVISHASLYVANPKTTDIPEPATLAVLAFGLVAAGFVVRRRMPMVSQRNR